MVPSREQELEDEVELLKQQLNALTGSSQELGVLMALRHGMTNRLAVMLFILVKRAPAVISRSTFHSVIYGDRSDGGPEPKIFDVHISRLRGILRRLRCPGKIETVWNAGYRASPELVAWVRQLYGENITKE
jgi:DNA-binding response OmpR family regulator